MASEDVVRIERVKVLNDQLKCELRSEMNATYVNTKNILVMKKTFLIKLNKHFSNAT